MLLACTDFPTIVAVGWHNCLLIYLWQFMVTVGVDGDADAAVENRIRIVWNKFRQLVPLLTNKDISLIVSGRLYNSCVWSSMLHGSETWPIRKENEVALPRAEIRMVRWMCSIELQGWVPSKGLRERERLELDGIISLLHCYYSKTGCDGIGMCCKKKTMIGWRNVWSMKWRVPGQEVDQRKLGEKLWKKTVRHINWTGSIPLTVLDGWSRLGTRRCGLWWTWVRLLYHATS